MQIRYYLTFIVIIGLFQSCQDDIIGESESHMITNTPIVNVAAGVSGIVTDSDGQSISNVMIQTKSDETLTDENGYFKIFSSKANGGGELLKFSIPGYFDNYKFYTPESGSQSFLRVEMVDKKIVGTLDSNSRDTIELNGGAKVSFPENAFINSSGSNYSGQVSVYAHWYNPTSNNLNTSMPGDLRGLNEEMEEVQLGTFGMMAVEIESNSGLKLELKDGVLANLEFPVPESLLQDASAEVLTWSLNENNGYWEQESTATLVGSVYKAEVSHFSFWNCDAPFPVVKIYGKIVNTNGDPLPFYSICIQVLNDTRTGYGWTDYKGNFSGKVPANERLKFQVKDDCGNIVLEQDIGPFVSETSLGEIIVDHPETLKIIGTLLDCDGNPVSNGYARIELVETGAYYIAETDDNGNFEISLNNCHPSGAITVQGFNLDDFSSSEILEFTPLELLLLDVGDLMTCEALDEFIQVKLESGLSLINIDVDAKIIDGKLIINTNQDSSGVFVLNAVIPNAVLGSNTDVSLFEFVLEDENTFVWASCGQNAGSNLPCDNFTFTITQLGIVGEYIEGEYMGKIVFQSNGATQIIMGSFRIRISSNLICEVEFVGLDLCELGTGAAVVYVFGGFPPYLINLSSPNGNTVDYQFDSETFELVDLISGQYNFLITDSNNAACDGQFQIWSDSLYYCELDFVNPSCGENNGVIEVFSNQQTGTGNIVYLWSTGETTQSISNLGPGTYSVTVQDVQGLCVTECQVVLEDVEDLIIQTSVGNASCGENNGSASVFSNVTGAFSYEWSNGATTQFVTGLAVGTYTVVVTDVNGCSAVATIEVLDTGFPQSNAVIVNPSCGRSSGSISISNPTGGCGGYIFELDGITLMDSVFSVISNLAEGTYTLGISDDCGCTTLETIELVNQSPDPNVMGLVWLDNDLLTPDVYDPGELLFSNIQVNVYSSDNLVDPLVTTFTDVSGYYYIENLTISDEYLIQVVLPQGYDFVQQNNGNPGDVDSDVVSSDGTQWFVIEPNSSPQNFCQLIDAGLKTQ